MSEAKGDAKKDTLETKAIPNAIFFPQDLASYITEAGMPLRADALLDTFLEYLENWDSQNEIQ